MNFWQFAADHPFTATAITFIALMAVEVICCAVTNIVNLKSKRKERDEQVH